MELDYIVVRRKVDTGHLQGADAVTAGVLALEPELPVGAILDVQTERLDDQGAHERNEDPEFTAIPDMPVVLIKPCAAGDFDLPVAADAVGDAKAAGMAWGIAAIGAEMSAMDGAGVRVAVIDTGINKDHPAFAGVTLSGRNFVDGEPDDVTDNNGHGTHCAGTIFGRDVDGTRIGIASGVTEAFIGKALDDQGRGKTSAVLEALRWAGDRKANVISMSLGFDFPGMVDRLIQQGTPARFATSMALIAYRETLKLFESYIGQLHLENAFSRGTIIVAASGNESQANVNPKFVIGASMPAASGPDVVSVGAAFRRGDGKLGIAPFSNIDPRLSGPGVDIVSASHAGGLIAMNGTSMACPHVAGAAALWWQNNLLTGGQNSATDVRATVIANARSQDFAPDVLPVQRGRGLVRAP